MYYVEHEAEGAGETDADGLGDIGIEGAGDGPDLKLVIVLYSTITLSYLEIDATDLPLMFHCLQ